MKGNTTYMAEYQGRNKDDVLNPFSDQACPPGSSPYAWFWYKNQTCRVGWCFDNQGPCNSTQGSETWGYFWASTMYQEVGEEFSRNKSYIAPGDRTLQQLYRDTTGQAATDYSYVGPSSYWYPPVFWQRPERFANQTRITGTPQNRFFFRRNKISDVLTPSQKVMLFEARDYVGLNQPQWNTAKSQPNVLFSDGSGANINMQTIISNTTDQPAAHDPPRQQAPPALGPLGAFGHRTEQLRLRARERLCLGQQARPDQPRPARLLLGDPQRPSGGATADRPLHVSSQDGLTARRFDV